MPKKITKGEAKKGRTHSMNTRHYNQQLGSEEEGSEHRDPNPPSPDSDHEQQNLVPPTPRPNLRGSLFPSAEEEKEVDGSEEEKEVDGSEEEKEVDGSEEEKEVSGSEGENDSEEELNLPGTSQAVAGQSQGVQQQPRVDLDLRMRGKSKSLKDVSRSPRGNRKPPMGTLSESRTKALPTLRQRIWSILSMPFGDRTAEKIDESTELEVRSNSSGDKSQSSSLSEKLSGSESEADASDNDSIDGSKQDNSDGEEDNPAAEGVSQLGSVFSPNVLDDSVEPDLSRIERPLSLGSENFRSTPGALSFDYIDTPTFDRNLDKVLGQKRGQSLQKVLEDIRIPLRRNPPLHKYVPSPEENADAKNVEDDHETPTISPIIVVQTDEDQIPGNVQPLHGTADPPESRDDAERFWNDSAVAIEAVTPMVGNGQQDGSTGSLDGIKIPGDPNGGLNDEGDDTDLVGYRSHNFQDLWDKAVRNNRRIKKDRQENYEDVSLEGLFQIPNDADSPYQTDDGYDKSPVQPQSKKASGCDNSEELDSISLHSYDFMDKTREYVEAGEPEFISGEDANPHPRSVISTEREKLSPVKADIITNALEVENVSGSKDVQKVCVHGSVRGYIQERPTTVQGEANSISDDEESQNSRTNEANHRGLGSNAFLNGMQTMVRGHANDADARYERRLNTIETQIDSNAQLYRERMNTLCGTLFREYKQVMEVQEDRMENYEITLRERNWLMNATATELAKGAIDVREEGDGLVNTFGGNLKNSLVTHKEATKSISEKEKGITEAVSNMLEDTNSVIQESMMFTAAAQAMKIGQVDEVSKDHDMMGDNLWNLHEEFMSRQKGITELVASKLEEAALWIKNRPINSHLDGEDEHLPLIGAGPLRQGRTLRKIQDERRKGTSDEETAVLSRDRCQELNDHGRAARPRRKLQPLPISMEIIMEPFSGDDGEDFSEYFGNFLDATKGFAGMNNEARLYYLTMYLKGSARKALSQFENDPMNRVSLATVAGHLSKMFDRRASTTSRHVTECVQKEGEDFKKYIMRLNSLVSKGKGGLFRDPDYQEEVILTQAKVGVLPRYLSKKLMRATTLVQVIEAYEEEWEIQKIKDDHRGRATKHFEDDDWNQSSGRRQEKKGNRRVRFEEECEDLDQRDGLRKFANRGRVYAMQQEAGMPKAEVEAPKNEQESEEKVQGQPNLEYWCDLHKAPGHKTSECPLSKNQKSGLNPNSKEFLPRMKEESNPNSIPINNKRNYGGSAGTYRPAMVGTKRNWNQHRPNWKPPRILWVKTQEQMDKELSQINLPVQPAPVVSSVKTQGTNAGEDAKKDPEVKIPTKVTENGENVVQSKEGKPPEKKKAVKKVTDLFHQEHHYPATSTSLVDMIDERDDNEEKTYSDSNEDDWDPRYAPIARELGNSKFKSNLKFIFNQDAKQGGRKRRQSEEK